MADLIQFTNKRAAGRPVYVNPDNVTTVEEQPGGGTRISFKSEDGTELQTVTVVETVQAVIRKLAR